MLSVESVPYTVGKQIVPAFQIGAPRFLQTKSREARLGDQEAENSAIRQIAISVYGHDPSTGSIARVLALRKPQTPAP